MSRGSCDCRSPCRAGGPPFIPPAGTASTSRARVPVVRITGSRVELTDAKGEASSAPAAMAGYAEGAAAAPLADQLRSEGVDVEVTGDAAEVDYIHGAIHSAWKVAAMG